MHLGWRGKWGRVYEQLCMLVWLWWQSVSFKYTQHQPCSEWCIFFVCGVRGCVWTWKLAMISNIEGGREMIEMLVRNLHFVENCIHASRDWTPTCSYSKYSMGFHWIVKKIQFWDLVFHYQSQSEFIQLLRFKFCKNMKY